MAANINNIQHGRSFLERLKTKINEKYTGWKGKAKTVIFAYAVFASLENPKEPTDDKRV